MGRAEDHEGDMSFLAEKQGVQLIQLDNLSNGSGLLGNVKALWDLYRLIKKEKPDLVHLHLMKARFFGGIAAKLARVPIIVETFHGNLLNGYFGRVKTAAILAAERFLGRLIVTQVIAISESQREELIRYRICPREKIDVIPLGLDLGRFVQCSKLKGELRKELDLPDETVLIGTVGRLVSIKGHNYLLQAIHRLDRSTDVDFCLLIVGDGDLRRDLEMQTASLGIGHRVRFLGWRFDLDKIYAGLDIVVLSSLNEGTPVSLIEAMAAGKAVVATRVGGVPDVVEDGQSGLLAPSKDPEALARALEMLLRDRGLRDGLGRRAKDLIYPRYDVSRLIQDMRNFYLKLMPVQES